MRQHMHRVRLKRQSCASALAAKAKGNDDMLTCNGDLSGVKAQAFEEFGLSPDGSHDALMSTDRTLQEPHFHHDLGVVKLAHVRTQIALGERLVERLVTLPNLVDGYRRHRLPPFLGQPFGGSAALVDVDVGRLEASDQASRPDVDPPLASSNIGVDALPRTVLGFSG